MFHIKVFKNKLNKWIELSQSIIICFSFKIFFKDLLLQGHILILALIIIIMFHSLSLLKNKEIENK